MSNSVATPSRAYESMREDRELSAALMGGTKTMRAAGKAYLPKEEAESDESYKARLQRTTFFNAYHKTVRNLVSKPFSKPIVLADDMDVEIKDWCEDVDLSGQHLDIFAADVFKQALADGISFILVDHPKVEQKITLADQRELNIRPYMVHINCRQIIGWKATVINGRDVLTEIRIDEEYTEDDPKDQFKEVTGRQIRVLRRGSYEIWRLKTTSQGKQEWLVHDQGTTTLKEIPLVPVYTNRKGVLLAEPPLMDLAYLNVEHWQSRSDQSHILHVARVPILFGAGIPEDTENSKIIVGPNRMVRVPDPNARLTYVEHTGAAIGAGRTDIEDIENRMRIMGLELLVKKASVTATERTLDGQDQECELQRMARRLEDALELALGFMAEWSGKGKETGGSVEVHKDYGISQHDATDLEHLFRARQDRAISQKTYLEELKRRGVLSDSLDVDDEIALVSLEAPAPSEDPSLDPDPEPDPEE